MSWLEAMILGLIQGLTEYLPVSSSGHLAIGSALFGIQGEENLAFTIVVHVATVCSTLVILWKEIDWIFKGLFKFQMNDETRYVINIVISMIPIGIKVTYNGTGKYPGHFKKSITLRTNAKTEMVRLYIEGDMTPKDEK